MQQGKEQLMRQGTDAGETPGAAAGKLKQQQAVRAKHSEKLRDILFREARRHVLQRDAGIDKVELASGKEAQIAGFVYYVLRAPSGMLPGGILIAAGVLDHGRRDIHSAHTVEVRGQRLGKPSDTASEVERCLFLKQGPKRFGIAEHCFDFEDTTLEEFLDVPRDILLFFGPRQNSAQRVLSGKRIPMLLQRTKVQPQLSTNRRTE